MLQPLDWIYILPHLIYRLHYKLNWNVLFQINIYCPHIVRKWENIIQSKRIFFNLIAEIIGESITFDTDYLSINQNMFFLKITRQTRSEV